MARKHSTGGLIEGGMSLVSRQFYDSLKEKGCCHLHIGVWVSEGQGTKHYVLFYADPVVESACG